MGDWLYIYYSYAKKYLEKTLAWYDGQPEAKRGET